MLIWILLALMTGAAVMTVLWPLSGRRPVLADGRDDVRFYEDQIAEIARDEARGLMAPLDAESARAEAGRRLIRARAASAPAQAATGEPALRRRRAAAAFALSVVPLVGLAVYGALGSPHLAIAPEGVATPAAEAKASLPAALAKIEAHLAREPGDVRGWEIVAPIYLRLGRAEDAARAYETAIQVGGEDAERLTGLGEAQALGSGGVVTAPAAESFRRALALDEGSPKARFYLALASEQDGDIAKARAAYEALLRSALAGAPWLPLVRGRLDQLAAREEAPGSGSAGASALSAGAQVAPEILAMVRGLDERLAAAGGSEADWSRLVRSYAVLGQPERALEKLAQARAALASDAGARERLERLGRELGLPAGAVARSGP
ncbi:MAG: c-type cytochrome biogenesis protein CcmI [Methylobacteriaceae bacterium]|nr:c-type cytochrome biogenesis protein CcmI [Methylobacteriaceae bacterium]